MFCDSLDGVALQESGATAESVALGTKFLGVAEFAVDVAVGTVASENRIQNTVTFVTVEARFVPHLVCLKKLIFFLSFFYIIFVFLSYFERTVPRASICSAAKTAPPHRGHPC